MKKIVLILMLGLALFASENKMQVFQPMTSTCPKSWLDDMKKIADEVEIVQMVNVKGLKYSVGVPREVQSCNTTIFKDYVFEGNVPAKAIKEFFKSIPKDSMGLSLPSYENEKEVKTVFLLLDNGTYKEFGKY